MPAPKSVPSVLLATFVAACAAAGGDDASRSAPSAAVAPPTNTAPTVQGAAPAFVEPDPDDPAVVHLALLKSMDAAIDAEAARAHVEARRILGELLPVPYLGLDVSPAPGGVRVDHVYPDTGAEASGLLPGDVLIRFGDVATTTKSTMSRAIRKRRVGEVVPLLVERDGERRTLQARIGPRPEEDEDEDEQFPDLARPRPLPQPIAFDFESDAAGSLPAALVGVLGGIGKPGRWVVVREGGASFLRQDEPDKIGIHFPMAIATAFDGADVRATVRFRYSGGRIDRAAGVVLRYQDPGNYLVARANAAEADLRIFRVANGMRVTLPGAIVACPADDDGWHTLEFRCEGALLTATLDGKATTTAYDTYFRRGAVGLWTKSDSRTDFDDLRVEALTAAPK